MKKLVGEEEEAEAEAEVAADDSRED